MKLSSISLIAAALAAIAGSITAAPSPRLFENVDIYSRSDVNQAIAANLDVASRAKKVGLHKYAKFHKDVAKRHLGYVQSRTHDSQHATWSIEMSKKTIARVEHAEAASLNRKAAHVARKRGMPKLTEFHEDLAEQNDRHALGGIQYRHFAASSKSWAYKTLHAQAASLGRDAAYIARMRGDAPRAQFHDDRADQDARYALGDTQDPDFAKTSIEEVHRTFAQGGTGPGIPYHTVSYVYIPSKIRNFLLFHSDKLFEMSRITIENGR